MSLQTHIYLHENKQQCQQLCSNGVLSGSGDHSKLLLDVWRIQLWLTEQNLVSQHLEPASELFCGKTFLNPPANILTVSKDDFPNSSMQQTTRCELSQILLQMVVLVVRWP